MNIEIAGSFLALSLISAVAFATPRGGGDVIGNGGDSLALEFVATLEKAWAFQNTLKSPSSCALPTDKAKTALPNLKVVTVDDPLVSFLDGVKQESTAINFPENQLILINRERWNSISNFRLKEGLALHEALSLLNVESTGNYLCSSKYVEHFGLSKDQLDQNFHILYASQSYESGGNRFSIEARARFVLDQNLSEGIRIEYAIKKNGKTVPAISSTGGMMSSCFYGEPGNWEALPSDWVSLVKVGDQTLGFTVKALGVCGNTTSLRFHLVLPSSARDYYFAEEFVSKGDLVFQEQQGKVHLWYLKQEWGGCGTAGSFFVPHRFLVGDATFVPKPLPLDPGLIPHFSDSLHVDLFHAYYVSGLQSRQWSLMHAARDYFKNDPEFIKWNVWCGLPQSVQALDRQVHAMKILGDPLQNLGF